jgi:hypothetical protein
MAMLTDLHAMFIGAGGEGVSRIGPDGERVPSPRREGVGVIMDCPCGCGTLDDGRGLFVPFSNPIDGGPRLERQGWQRTGDTIETLTLHPSVLRADPGGCRWHGWIRGGAAVPA